MRFQPLTLGGFITSTVLAVKLYVSSYSGTIFTLELTYRTTGYSTSIISTSSGLLIRPSFLSKNKHTSVIYCTDENLSGGNGSVAVYTTSKSGKLTQIDKVESMFNVISQVVHNSGKGLAVASYGSSSLQNYRILSNGSLSLSQTFIFPQAANSLETSHPHEALVDPTDSYIIVPDLGANLIRVFSIDPSTSALTETKPYQAPAGSGPRHGAFVATSSGTYFLLVSELANTVSSYKVTYGATGLTFREVSMSGTFGNATVPAGSTAADAILTPDNKFLLTTSRNATVFQVPNFDPSNSTAIPSDTLQAWEIDPTTGKLKFKQLAPAGGRIPRQFSVNNNGTLVAVAVQDDKRIVIIKRNMDDGTFGKFVAEIEGLGEVSSVIWDD